MRLLPVLWATLHQQLHRHRHPTILAETSHIICRQQPPSYYYNTRMASSSKRSISALFSTSTNNSEDDVAPTTHRILCYGDSLTAGTSIHPFELFPYAPHLERTLNENNDHDPSKSNIKYVVRHRGMPGWRASAMLDAADDAQYGLRAAIQGIQDPPLSCVIILAGTNDLGFALAGGGGDNDSPAQIVLQDIQALHQMAWDAGVKHTIAVAIPPSGYQARVAEASFLALEINQALEDFCNEKSEGRATFVPFPFEFEFCRDDDDDDTNNWSPDGLHFSPKGYQRLGESLRNPVLKVLSR